ncbi:MAG: hypothetical protein LBU85_11575 [Treponema sp.]|jgi:hypothetical protein|nr:hypothetical protein [Treponema sp.]
MVFGKCKTILLKECELVRRIASLQNLVYEAVLNRDWNGFEANFSKLGEIGKEFSALESERERLFEGIQTEANVSAKFYSLTAGLPPGQRAELTEIYRNLKLETLKVRIAGETIMNVIAGARATVAGFFEIAFPDRKGKIYTPYGMPVSHDMRSMVLNRSF